jgi:hypothetical protein
MAGIPDGAPRALTIGSIAQREGVAFWKIRYAIKVLGLSAVAWAGHSRLFTESDVQAIHEFLEQRQQRRVAG